MFQTDLPSHRRRLLVFVLVVFLVVGFAVRFVLVKLGWTDQPRPTATEPSAPSAEPSEPAAVSSLPPEELSAVTETANRFIRAYTTIDFSDRSKWLHALDGLTGKEFYQYLQEEATARPADGLTATSFGKIERLQCSGSGLTASCIGAVVVQEQKGQQFTPVERVYQLSLAKEGEHWVVEEAEVRGDFD
ncbi:MULTISPECIES: hypothetical protein [unclassified Thermoactinomyces]|jgi:hypothetical protein|uniref:hypothetical protein n=1 Tax=unclassified Thermoactinomyces TaxID=2634588 RepID=UPI0018DCC306|nr:MULTISPECIES: hypothetical protein [unclassified Thermoactinomyces]MBH8598990.1 hypothetical protein [Thermoactinomyces sp. CICC 10523]MBH8604976.1 hypothetical protein [Thermoactinomyces sp. CICC 10522]MBH8608416.1 hypothetical protein [Thermoactinomyces sp. CICC 10521]